MAIVSNSSVGSQEITVDTTAPLGGNATFTSSTKDSEGWPYFSISVYVERNVADTNVDATVENSNDGVTWRVQDRTNLQLTASQPVQILNRVYSITRRYIRVRLVNNTANALAGTELTTIQKSTD